MYLRPYTNQFSPIKASVSHNVLSLLILLSPAPPQAQSYDAPPRDFIHPQDLLPTIFHLWTLVPRSSLYDYQCLDLVATIVSDSISSSYVDFKNPGGLLTEAQLNIAFSAILRLLEIPVSSAGSPYLNSGETVSLAKDGDRKPKCARPIAFLVVYSLAGDIGGQTVLERFSTLISACETFCHPSNYGSWTRNIMYTICTTVEYFVLRWNVQQSGESMLPLDRRLNARIRDQFVDSLLPITMMGIHAKTSQVVSWSLEALQGLAHLCPFKVIPRVLVDAYTSLQNVESTHRAVSAFRALTFCSTTIIREPAFAMHIATLLDLSLPGIDANDLTKTRHTLSFIQHIALQVPLRQSIYKSAAAAVPTKDDPQDTNYNRFNYAEAANYGERSSISGPSVAGAADAAFAVSQAIAHLDATQQAPQEYIDDKDEAWSICCGTSSLFEEFVHSFFGRVFTLIGNLPETASHDSAESLVMNALPPCVTAVVGAMSQSQISKTVDYVIRLLASADVACASPEPAAHVCGALVRVDAETAFPKLFPFLNAQIRFEIDENNAGKTRNSGRKTLPRDRALIWYLSSLNMILAHAGQEAVKFGRDLLRLTMHMRRECGGAILYHAANTVHHTLMTLTSTFVREGRDWPEEYGTAPWGPKVDCDALKVDWHVPTEAELEFAVKMYERHARENIDAIMDIVDRSPTGRVGPTEASDILSSSATYLRTMSGGIALLAQSDANRVEQDHRHALDRVSPSSSPFLESPNYPYSLSTAWHKAFQTCNASPSLLSHVAALRNEVGVTLHQLLKFLEKRQDNASQKAALFAVKVWFSDVGFERSAKSLESMIGLYNYETRIFRLPGLRKDYPRRVLVKRAQLYHLQRQRFAFAPHEDLDAGMGNMAKKLAECAMESAISVFSDVRRNGVAALDAVVKMYTSQKRPIYHWVLEQAQVAAQAKDWHKTEAAVLLLSSALLQLELIRDVSQLLQLVELIRVCVLADDLKVNRAANSCYNSLVTKLRLPLDDAGESQGPALPNVLRCCEDIKPIFHGKSDAAELIAAEYANMRSAQRVIAESCLVALIEKLTNDKTNGESEHYWKIQAMNAGYFSAICSSPQFPADGRALRALCQGAAFSPQIGIQTLCKHGLFRVTSKIFNLAASGYDYGRFLLDCDEENLLRVSDDAFWVDSSVEGFTKVFENEMGNVASPQFYLDRASTSSSVGWLIWPMRFAALDAKKLEEGTDTPVTSRLSETDRIALSEFGKLVDQEWVEQLITLNMEEKRTTETEEYFDVTNAIFYKIVLRLIGYGYASITLNEFLSQVKSLVFDDLTTLPAHRCGAELTAAVVDSLKYTDPAGARAKIEWLSEIYTLVLEKLSLDNVEHWASFVWWGCNYIDIRRGWKQHRRLMLDLDDLAHEDHESSVGASRLCARLEIVRNCLTATGWHLQDPKLADSLFAILSSCKHLAAVREEVTGTIAIYYASQYHESNQNAKAILENNINCNEVGRVGHVGYKIDSLLAERLIAIAEEITGGKLEGSDLVDVSKSLCLLVKALCNKSYGSSLVAIMPQMFPAILSFVSGVSAKDADLELARSGLSLLKSLGNLPYPVQYIEQTVDLLVSLVKNESHSITWHEKLALLAFLQAFFFRQLFKLSEIQRQSLLGCIKTLLHDSQLEVRDMASETLAGVVRCSPSVFQHDFVTSMIKEWGQVLSVTSRKDQSYARHGAVLGLGALVRAYPYESPPPSWIPQVVTYLAKAAEDSGMVGRSVKETLAQFKKTRQDTWQYDIRVFTMEQLEDLEGVLWRNYFV